MQAVNLFLTRHVRCFADLVPREVAESWLKYLREELPTVAFKCSTQRQAANLGQRRLPSASSADGGFTGSECLGAESLLQLLKNYARASDIKTAITVGECILSHPFRGPPCSGACAGIQKHCSGSS